MNSYVITALESARPKGWFELFHRPVSSVDGKPPILIDAETIFRHSLKVGDELSEQLLRRIKTEADIAWLKAKGMAILSRRMISERDLRRKLTEEKRPKDAREDVIFTLKRLGLVDDAKYAANFVRTQLARGPKSKLYLKSKLREKGVNEECSNQAIEAEFAGVDEVSAVRTIAEKKYKTVKYLPTQKARIRVINFLRSRGFNWETIRKATADLFPNQSDISSE